MIPRVSGHGDVFMVAPAFAELLRKNHLLSTRDFVLGRLGHLSREDPYRENRILTLDGRRFYLKIFHYHRLYIWLWGMYKLNPPSMDGPSEWEAHRILRESGIRTPLPVAAGRCSLGPLRRGSFFMSLHVEGRPLDAVLAEPLAPRARRRLAERVGSVAADLHRAGWVHRDLYLCHLFVPSGAEPGEQPLVLIDLQRARPQKSRRGRRKDLAALLGSSELATRLERFRALKSYGVPRPSQGFLEGIIKKARRMGFDE